MARSLRVAASATYVRRLLLPSSLPVDPNDRDDRGRMLQPHFQQRRTGTFATLVTVELNAGYRLSDCLWACP